MRKIILALFASFGCLSHTEAAVRFVNLNATGTGNGTSWSNAFIDFQAAIDASVSGDSIFVATAIYQPARGNSFSMKEGVKIFGGFTGTETAFNQRDLGNKATLLGNGASVFLNDNNGLTAAAELDGFLISKGNAARGGGMYNINNVSPVIRNCIFKNNATTAVGNGGGMYNYQNSDPTLINCVFTANSTGGNGGGMTNVSSNPSIINCVFWANASGDSGGGIYNLFSSPVITNTIIWNNLSIVNTGNGLFVGSSSAPVVTFCDIQDHVVTGIGNISADPLFTNAVIDDFSLQSISPCINSGSSAANSTEVDLLGNTRVVGAAIDMGVAEFQGITVPVDLVDFVGSLQNSMAFLEWKSGEENNLNRYIIEKSVDGVSFGAVGTLPAKGNNSHYTFALSQSSQVAYFRLQMVDNSNKKTYSNVVRLSNGINGTISVHPNPATDYIRLNALKAGKVYLFNASGVIVKVMPVEAGPNEIGIQELSKGVYFIRLDDAELKFIKR